MTKSLNPVERAEIAIDWDLDWSQQEFGIPPESPDIARAVFGSIDTEGLTRVLAAHQLGEPLGGTASVATCECSCGEQNEVPGGPRDFALHKARLHVASAIKKHLLGDDK